MREDKNDLGATPQRSMEAGSIEPDAATARHTEGPWRVRVTGCDTPLGSALGTITYIESGDVEIAVMYDDTDQAANAHLIAAAPEMYEALKAHDAYMLDAGYSGPDDSALHHKAAFNWTRVRAAIAKAEGRSVGSHGTQGSMEPASSAQSAAQKS